MQKQSSQVNAFKNYLTYVVEYKLENTDKLKTSLKEGLKYKVVSNFKRLEGKIY